MSTVLHSNNGRVSLAFRPQLATRIAVWLILLYAVYAATQLGFSWERFSAGLGNGAKFLGRMFPPDVSKGDILWDGIKETLQIAVLASLFGILLSLPIGLMGARNLMPAWISWPARAFVSVCRSLHPVIVAILFVKAVGFGALAGVLALIVASIGFIGKLFAEAIEEISIKQVEAIRATGASFMNVILFGVLPQVLSRFVGFSTYQLDSNLRNSTMVGIVGAGGVGGVLFSAFQRFDYDFVFTILVTIITIIVVGELLANSVKKVFHV
ncbi:MULTISPECIES: phosphonate ABC transporter, permease protein PhnE [unclassified Herbaspirillum]|uniref:phosphonate ABC transporter, permease protein PhnE n=1 Tax=unclassified Herbaspirillum TaxID=2624150 RepID=UPI001154450A|nr:MULTISPECIES: phosphonate ABC transporter, permease protein PhnE [unclassified Herbaspirillum]MBB5389860.1 phosphonate transport system permease protein [Herbaspirillum sp. SJZ102]TQK09627.1 phosphonate transport system permease protein [Herbaspirillum sp. SJZ130]TQK13686.1 phosphonate transport system permease protein [Herbaspirillum sp. SJZ106]TWC69403.1 phosphonate transport system permease protein [Herbaspirillum sp. SJZ099]